MQREFYISATCIIIHYANSHNKLYYIAMLLQYKMLTGQLYSLCYMFIPAVLLSDDNSMKKCCEMSIAVIIMSMQTSVFQNLLEFDLRRMIYKHCRRNTQNWNQIKNSYNIYCFHWILILSVTSRVHIKTTELSTRYSHSKIQSTNYYW